MEDIDVLSGLLQNDEFPPPYPKGAGRAKHCTDRYGGGDSDASAGWPAERGRLGVAVRPQLWGTVDQVQWSHRHVPQAAVCRM